MLFIVQDDTGFGQLGCYGSPIKTPNLDALAKNGLLLQQHAHDGALLADSLVHPDRPQPPLERDVLHHRRLHRLPRRQRLHPVRERLPLRDPAAERLQHVRARQVAPDAARADHARRVPTTAGRSAAASSATTASSAATRISTTRSWSTTTTRSSPRRRPEEGYHLTEDLVDQAISFIADAKQVAPNKPFFMYFCPGAAHAPHHVPKEWADKYKGKFDDGWDAYREKVFARQKELGIIPKDAELSRHDPDVPDWKTLSADEKKLYARMMEVFAGFLEHTDHHYGRLFDFLKNDRRVRQHADHVHLRQRRQRRGRPDRVGQREQVLQQRAGLRSKQNLAADRRARRAEVLQSLRVGLDVRRQHAVPPLEARDLPRRHQRPVHRPLAEGHQGQGRGPRRNTRTPSTWCRRCSRRSGIEAPTTIKGVTQSPIEGLSFAHAFDDAKAPSKHITQYFEMFGHRSIYHDGWRAVCPWPGTSFKEAGMFFGAPIDDDKLTELDAKGWELYHIDKDFAENHNLAAENRAKLIEMIAHVVRRGRQVQCPADRQPRHAALRASRARRSQSTGRATPTTRARRRCRPTRPRRS